MAIPAQLLHDRLKVDPLDVAVLVVVHNNMSPTYEVGDRLIIDFKQKTVTADGVYIFMDQNKTMHIQRIRRDNEQLIVSNDNPAKNAKHPSKIVDENNIEIVGRICGMIAAR